MSLLQPRVKVYGEEAVFRFAADHTVFYPEEESFFSHNERSYLPRKMSSIAPATLGSMPAVVDAGGVKIAIADSDVEDYPGMWLRGTGGNVPYPNVVLFQPQPGQTYSPTPYSGSLITDGQQIKDILTWAIGRGANLQIGQIDPSSYQAWYPVQNVKCGDALRHCLRRALAWPWIETPCSEPDSPDSIALPAGSGGIAACAPVRLSQSTRQSCSRCCA